MENKEKRVLFIGAGRMAQAMIEGLHNKEEFSILVTNNGNKERLKFIQETYGVETTENWQNEMNNIDIIILAMPPEVHKPILNELAQLLDGQLVITVAAGIGPTFLEKHLGNKTPVAWAIPNTAAKLGESITLYATGEFVSQEHVGWIERLISGIGEFEKVTEQQVHELTAVTGSAPAFIYRVAEALEQIAVETGVTKDQARKMVAQMIFGSAAMLKTNIEANELVNQVATPGGSTAAGLDVLEEKHLNQIIHLAIDACRNKAKVGTN